MNRTVARAVLVSIAMLLLTAAYYRTESAPAMSGAARNFLDSLTPEQRARATFAFQDEERFDWHFIPRPRKGLPFKEMTPPQRHLAQALLAAGLSQKGVIKANTIMSLEDVLRVLENDSGERRDPERYYFSLFGEPSLTGTWGYRVEGHHLSLNFTLVDGRVAASPSFFGANPAEVRQGPRKGLRTLAAEEDLARDLLGSFTAEQKAAAIVEKQAYKDILTSNSRKAALEGQPSGLAAAKMTAKQRQLLQRLLEEYAFDMPEQLAQARMEQVRGAGMNLHFAWAGAEERGRPHYYRIQAPAFLVEYDNTQNNANHIHSVWRDSSGDFGLDLLQAHYTASHRR